MLKTLISQIKQYKSNTIKTPIYVAIEVIMEVLIPFLMAILVDQGIENGDMKVIWIYGFVMLIAAIISLIAGALSGKHAAIASSGFAKNLREAEYKNIQNFAFADIDKYSTGGLITRKMTDVTNVQNAFQMLIRVCVRSPLMLISSLFMAFMINHELALVFVGVIIFLGIVLFGISMVVHPIFRRLFKRYDYLNASVQENVSGIRVVKAYVREDHEIEKFHKESDLIFKIQQKAEKILIFNSPVMQLSVYGCILLISWLGAHMIVGGSMTTGELMSLFTYTTSILMSLMMLSMVFVMVTMSAASAERVTEVINETADLHDPQDPVMEVADGSIEFDHVDFSYKKDSKEPVLKDINLSIRAGETIGIIGGTGSAKSSLVNLISRLYDVSSGSVKVGGVDVRDYHMDSLRNQVAVVLQKNVLFSGTILENLRWGNKEASEKECRRACQLSCADDFIEKMPDKYNTYIEQGGTNVSGGQKQRLCIARALLKKPKVLILDDSTSAVDTATDARIRRAFAEEIPDTTKLIIAQRISSIQSADRIIVMDEGKISGFGTHEELMKTNAIYQEVYNSQIKGGGDFDENRGGEQA